jgi:hypothetical protein
MLLNHVAVLISMIRWSWRMSIVSVVLSCSLVNAAAASVTGTVVDSEGAAIEKAHIVIRADTSGKREAVKGRDLILETDREGQFSANFPPGFYDLCVMANAFSPHCEKIFVDHAPLAPKIKLKADPEVIRRLGDTF